MIIDAEAWLSGYIIVLVLKVLLYIIIEPFAIYSNYTLWQLICWWNIKFFRETSFLGNFNEGFMKFEALKPDV